MPCLLEKQVMDRLGRKTILVFCQLLAGTTCIIAGLVSEDATGVITALTLAGTPILTFKD
jgi:hypothetical protein